MTYKLWNFSTISYLFNETFRIKSTNVCIFYFAERWHFNSTLFHYKPNKLCCLITLYKKYRFIYIKSTVYPPFINKQIWDKTFYNILSCHFCLFSRYICTISSAMIASGCFNILFGVNFQMRMLT